MNGTSCDRCEHGFVLDDTNAEDIKCVAADSCPAMYYAEKATGKCEMCSSNCATCERSPNTCTSCPDTLLFLQLVNKCFTVCPMGTYNNAGNCIPCQNGAFNCDPATGAPNEMMPMDCSPNCAGCFWSPNFCINCEANFKKASHGRCVENCPPSTFEVTHQSGAVECRDCTKGCLKCVTEDATCHEEDTPSGNMVARCLRCDKERGWFLFRDKCVKAMECPHGTFPDRITGWCAKCDCNCGNGGCTDRNTCKSCPSPNMSINPETGRCVCDTTFSAQWADDWKSFTVTIDSPDVIFRNMMAELDDNHIEINSKKMCRIGNEVTYEAIARMNNETMDEADMPEMPISRCGSMNASLTELDRIINEFEAGRFDNSSISDRVPGGRPTDGGDSMLPSGDQMGPSEGESEDMEDDFYMYGDGSEDEYPFGPDTDWDSLLGGGDNEIVDFRVGLEPESCPANNDRFNIDDLRRLGIENPGQILRYIQRLGTNFGYIGDDELEMDNSPRDGLEFTTQPLSLCALLFDQYTLNRLDTPTCTLMRSATQTMIKVVVGGSAMIEPDYHVKFFPNVFVRGCDWPVLNMVPITNGPVPDSLQISFFPRMDQAPFCTDYMLTILAEGNIGELSCRISLKGVYDTNGDLVVSQNVTDLMMNLTDLNEYIAIYGIYWIPDNSMRKLNQEGVSYLHFRGKCHDAFGQESFINKKVELVAESGEITMDWEYGAIQYDSQYGASLYLDFEYYSCANQGPAHVDYNVTIQVYNASDDSWAHVVGVVAENNYIPQGLSDSMVYRLHVVAFINGTDITNDFLIDIEQIQYEPFIKLDDFSTLLIASEDNDYTFSDEDFIYVANVTDAQLSFSCTTCDGEE